MWEGPISVRRRIRALSPRAVLASAFAVFVVYGFPGYMSSDSVLALTEARTGHFSDGNPPLMAAEWWILDKIISGPVLMLFLQGALLLGGLYVLLRRVLEPRGAAWAAAGIFVFPPVMVTMAVIWKDSQMAAYLIAGTAALIQPRLRTRLIGLVLLVAACSIRHNAVAAVVPLIAILFEWRHGLRWTKRLAIVAGVALVVGAAGFGVTRVLATKHVRLTPVFNDIVGVIAYTDHRSDAEFREVLRGVPLAIDEGFQPHAAMLVARHHGWLVMTRRRAVLHAAQTEADWDAVDRAWKDLVFGDPRAYLSFHIDQFARLLHFADGDLGGGVWNRFLESDDQLNWVDHDASFSWFQERFGLGVLYKLDAYTPLFHPWIYALLALVLLPLCRRALPAALFVSGWLYELSFFPVGVEPECRYSHWLVLATCLGAVVLFVQRRQRRSAAGPARTTATGAAMTARVTPRRILIAAAVVYVLYGYPGYMMAGAGDELMDSRVGQITDWHSPMLTEVWRVCGRLFSGPAPLFLLLGACVLFGSYALLRHRLTDRGAAFGAAGVLLAPPILATTAVMTPDAALAAFLVAGAALLLEPSPRRRAGGLAVLVIAAGLREGAIAAVVPVLAGALRWPVAASRWRQLAAALVASVVVAGLAFGIDRLLVVETTHRREAALAMTDLAGTLAHAQSFDDATLARELPGVPWAVTSGIQARARIAAKHPYDLDHGVAPLFERPTTTDQNEALIAGARRLSWLAPGAYVRHRLGVLRRVLGLSRDKRWRPVHTEFVQPRSLRLVLAHAAHHSLAQRALIAPVRALGRTFVFRPYLYLAFALVLFGFALARHDGLAAMLVISAIGYELVLGIVTTVPTFQASGWLIVATVLAGIVMLRRSPAASA